MGFRAISLPTMSNKYELIRSKETDCPICIFDNENQVRVCTFNSSNPAIESEAVKVLDGLNETATLHAQIARMKMREGELVGALTDLSMFSIVPHLPEDMVHTMGEPFRDDKAQVRCSQALYRDNAHALKRSLEIARAALQSVAKEEEQ